MITISHHLSDKLLDNLYPPSIKALGKEHWTPVHIACEAARFLVGSGNRLVLDIGSGVGKFCLAAASLFGDSYFFGVEQREYLVEHAEVAKQILRLNNAIFIYANFTQIDLGKFDSFYFFDSFHENLDRARRIDNQIAYSRGLYKYYTRYLLAQLALKPSGTRLCTLYSPEDEIPDNYLQVGAYSDNSLKCWIRV